MTNAQDPAALEVSIFFRLALDFSFNVCFKIHQADTIILKHFIHGYKNAAQVHRWELNQDSVIEAVMLLERYSTVQEHESCVTP